MTAPIPDLRLRLIGDPVLRRRAEPVPGKRIGSPEIQVLIDRMVDMMRAAPGVGLAAPQIGHSLRIVVLEDPPELQERLSPEQRMERGRLVPFPLTVMINPELRLIGEERILHPEGCLSVPGYTALVSRASALEVRWTDRAGVAQGWTRLQGWPARIVQHEIDHLDGTLYTDRMEPRSFMAVQHADQLGARLREAAGA